MVSFLRVPRGKNIFVNQTWRNVISSKCKQRQNYRAISLIQTLSIILILCLRTCYGLLLRYPVQGTYVSPAQRRPSQAEQQLKDSDSNVSLRRMFTVKFNLLKRGVLTCQKMLSIVFPRKPSRPSEDTSLGPRMVMNSSKSTWPSPGRRKCKYELKTSGN